MSNDLHGLWLVWVWLWDNHPLICVIFGICAVGGIIQGYQQGENSKSLKRIAAAAEAQKREPPLC